MTLLSPDLRKMAVSASHLLEHSLRAQNCHEGSVTNHGHHAGERHMSATLINNPG